ncbi:MAG: hypothetical protein ABIS20_18020 [Thermoanaerobaculia bacterium]
MAGIARSITGASILRSKGEESAQSDDDRDQIAERLSWTPKQRLEYLVDMVAFEERAHGARRLA